METDIGFFEKREPAGTIKLLPQPGARKQAIWEMTPCVRVAAEIGADHGITSAYLLREGVCERIIVSDISAASLEKAKRLFALHGLEGRADFRVADGLDAIEDAGVGAIVIAGMGAQTMCGMLQRGRAVIGDAALVLQPKPNPQDVRRWLANNGFCIEAERLVHENRRFYAVMRARRGEASYSEKELLLGPCLLRERPQGFEAYLRWHRDCLSLARGEAARRALEWIEEELRAWATL